MFKSTLRKIPKLIFTKGFLVTLCLLTITFTGIAHAGIYSPQAFQDALKKAGTSKQKFDAQSTTNLLNTNFCILTGCDDEANDFKKGALGTSTEMVAMLYTPPASGVMYVADVINKFGVVQPAYAQSAGFGFNNLNALLPIWRAFRDFTYLFFVLILVVAGFGIMFRWKLNPQTVITIQSALPRIVIALLLVTFSYAISGLVVDFLYVLIAIPAMILGPIWTPGTGIHELQDQFLRGNFADLAGALWGQTAPLSTLSLASTGLVAMIGGLLGAVIAAPIVLGGFAAGAGVGALLVALIIAIIVIIQLFRLFFALLQTYIAIILLIVLAPVQIALGVIPGIPGFGAWFKSLVANILVFVAVAVVLMLGMVISHQLNTNALWSPPFLPFFVPAFASGLIGLGILLVIHQVPQLVRNALGVRGLGLNPQEGFRPITNIAAGAFEAEAQRRARAPLAGPGAGMLQSILAQAFRGAGGR